MSKSIRLHIELLIQAGKKKAWQHYTLCQKVYDTRLHDLIISHAFPPGDEVLSQITLMHMRYNTVDLHHPGVLPSKRVQLLEAKYKGQTGRDLDDEIGYLFGHTWSGWFHYPDSLAWKQWRALGLMDFRFIFWFVG